MSVILVNEQSFYIKHGLQYHTVSKVHAEGADTVPSSPFPDRFDQWRPPVPTLWLRRLVGGWALPLWTMMEFVSWDEDIPNMMGKIKKCSKPPTTVTSLGDLGSTMGFHATLHLLPKFSSETTTRLFRRRLRFRLALAGLSMKLKTNIQRQ